MKNIAKRKEPQSLTQHRIMNPTDYDGYSDKEKLRVSLIAEQRGICCYCMGKIRADSMKIEHWQAQSRYPMQRLVYANLLGACVGSEGHRRSDQHCDSYKGDEDLSRNPANLSHNVEALVRFLPNGHIASSDLNFNHEIERVLNLNVPVLVSHRREVLRAFQRTLDKRGALSRQSWDRLLVQWNGEAYQDNDLQPYCQVIVYWIQKKLARMTH